MTQFISAQFKKRFFVYIVRCADATFYTGYTSLHPLERAQRHSAGNGAKYTRSRRPVRLVYMQERSNQRAAMREERAIKRLTREAKMALIESTQNEINLPDDD